MLLFTVPHSIPLTAHWWIITKGSKNSFEIKDNTCHEREPAIDEHEIIEHPLKMFSRLKENSKAKQSDKNKKHYCWT